MRINSGVVLVAFGLGFAALTSSSAYGQGTTVASRLATQNTLFEDYYQAGLKLSPETATEYGDYRYNDKLDDYSLKGAEDEHRSEDGFLARLKAISTEGFTEQDVLSHDLLVRTLEQLDSNYRLKTYEMPLSHFRGVQLTMADLPLSMPFDSVKHYEDYIARLHQIPRAFTQTEEVIRAGMKDNLVQVRFLLEKIPPQCDGIVKANPFMIPTTKYPSGISAADQARLTKEITDAVNKEVLPAYKSFGEFIAKEYAPKGRTTLSIKSLPGGEERYANAIRALTTVSDMSANQIHELGMKEMERIQAEILAVAKKAGFADVASFRESLKTNPKYVPTSAEQILDGYRKYIAQMQLKLPALFTYIPGSPVTVEAIPSFEPGQSTHYQTGTPDGKRPGRVSVQTSDFAHRTTIQDEATAYHEGIPGHHMQRSVAQQMTGLPKFRLHIGNSGYTEGWALYSEELGKEVGFYQDPASDYGRLTSELFRAVRLVVDTGIHEKGWSRDRVVDFFRKSGAVDEPLLQSETDRYISWPGQALSYKLGQLKFRELRERAKAELGPKFDIRTFHDEMLSGGVLPLDMLDARTNAWIAAQKKVAAGD
jgi:uncharacterized protein (DUF885 family)